MLNREIAALQEFVRRVGEEGQMKTTPKNPSFAGRTLRDGFAGQALAGTLAGRAKGTVAAPAMDIAAGAYAIADAMLAEREKEI